MIKINFFWKTFKNILIFFPSPSSIFINNSIPYSCICNFISFSLFFQPLSFGCFQLLKSYLLINQLQFLKVDYKAMVKKMHQTTKNIKKKPFNQCIICLNNSAEATIQCSHQFCFKCIKTWCKRNRSCPICRRRINLITQGTKKISFQEQSQEQQPAQIQLSSNPMFVRPIFFPLYPCMFYWDPYFYYQPTYQFVEPFNNRQGL